MRFRRAAYIFNPVAGEGTGRAVVGQVLEILRANAAAVHPAPTQFPRHATKLAREAVSAGSDLVVVQGGDGTVNEAVQGMVGADSAALLALPGGTANVLAEEVGLPTDPVGAAGALPRLKRRSVRLGLAAPAGGASRYFLLMCGAGLDAEIAATIRTPLKHRFGVGAFWLRGAAQLFRRFPRVVVREGAPQGGAASALIVVSKSRRYGGGLVLTPGANLLADRFEIVHFEGTSRLLYCGYLLAVVCAATSRWPGIRHEGCSCVTLVAENSEPVRLQVDGELAGSLPARISLSKESIDLLLPPDYGLPDG